MASSLLAPTAMVPQLVGGSVASLSQRFVVRLRSAFVLGLQIELPLRVICRQL